MDNILSSAAYNIESASGKIIYSGSYFYINLCTFFWEAFVMEMKITFSFKILLVALKSEFLEHMAYN
ncbi:MAG: hypothetical protein IPO04_15265 [Cytophagaceae bacterium]|nr:hypothetical protein [Cytophagaceae bacterium]